MKTKSEIRWYGLRVSLFYYECTPITLLFTISSVATSDNYVPTATGRDYRDLWSFSTPSGTLRRQSLPDHDENIGTIIFNWNMTSQCKQHRLPIIKVGGMTVQYNHRFQWVVSAIEDPHERLFREGKQENIISVWMRLKCLISSW